MLPVRMPPRQPQDYDVCVVGAGFAGLCCAEAAAARGTRTLVLERQAAPGERPRTTGILVKEIADAWDFPARLTRRIHGVRLYSPSLDYLDLTSPGYYFLATDTPGILRWLGERAAQAGATIAGDRPYRGAEREAASIRLAGHDLRCRYLVGADGARSRVARDFSLDGNRHFLLGVEAEYEGIGGLDEDRFHVFLDSVHAPGYIGWVIPGVGITQVGLAVRRPHTPDLAAFTAKLATLFDFSQAQLTGRRGGLIPCDGVLRRISDHRVLLVGDAAGMVSPLTAGGIHPAMEIGRAAGIAISDHLLEAAPHPLRAVRQVTPSYLAKRMMRLAYDTLPMPDRAWNILFRSPLFRHLAQTIFFHHRGLLSFEAWRDLLRLTRGA